MHLTRLSVACAILLSPVAAYCAAPGVRAAAPARHHAARKPKPAAKPVPPVTTPRLATYTSPGGWSIDYPGAWHPSDMSEAGASGDPVVYLQPAEDSAERLAVAVVPAEQITSGDLMKQVMMDAPQQYDLFRVLGRKDTVHAGLPAAWLTFAALYERPDVYTKSMVLVVVREGRGYVVNARYRVSQAPKWEALLHEAVRSLRFALPAAPAVQRSMR